MKGITTPNGNKGVVVLPVKKDTIPTLIKSAPLSSPAIVDKKMVDASQNVSSPSKTTVDSSVYSPKTIPTSKNSGKKDDESQLIKGTLLPVKKDSITAAKIVYPEQTIIQDQGVITITKPQVLNVQITNGDTATIKETPVFVKKEMPAPVYGKSPLSTLDTGLIKNQTYSTVQTDLKSKEIKGELTPQNGSSTIVPSVPQKFIETLKQKIEVPVQPVKEETPVFVKKELPPPVYGKSPLSTLDTGLIKNQTYSVVQTDLRSKEIKGELTPQSGSSLIEPSVPDVITITKPEVFSVTTTEADAATIKETPVFVKKELPPPVYGTSPLSFLDSSLIGKKPGDKTEIKPAVSAETVDPALMGNNDVVNTVPQKLVAQTISNGTYDAKEGTSKIFTPVPDTAVTYKILRSPLDALDTVALERDYLSNYTTPPLKSDLKAQNITGTLLSAPGLTQTVEPFIDSTNVGKDAGLPLNYSDYTVPAAAAFNAGQPTTSNTTATNNNSNVITSNNGTILPPADAQPVKPTVFVTQNGKFSVSFANNYFYLTVGQNGTIADYALLSNGTVINNASNRVQQVGNIKVNYNYRGFIDNIAGTPVQYNYDNKVYMVGDIPLTYNYKGNISRLKDMPFVYNEDGTIDKIGNYKVNYNKYGLVESIDDSNGLIVFKPVIEK